MIGRAVIIYGATRKQIIFRLKEELKIYFEVIKIGQI